MPWFSSELSNFFETDDFFTDDFWNKVVMDKPALNIKETDHSFEIVLAAPGLSKEDFSISIDDGYLNIMAEKTSKMEESDDQYTRKEFNFDSFKRSLLLPETVEQDSIKAIYENGLLQLNLEKKEVSKLQPSKTIEIS